MEEFNIQGKQTSFYKYCPGTFGYIFVKGNVNGYMVPGGIARPPCPKGGVGLQDGGWARGQQPVTLIKLTVRKSKLWP